MGNFFLSFCFSFQSFSGVLPAELPAQRSRHLYPGSIPIPAGSGARFQPAGAAAGSPPCRDVSRASRNPRPWIFRRAGRRPSRFPRPFKGFSCSAPAPAEGLLSQPPFLDTNWHFPSAASLLLARSPPPPCPQPPLGCSGWNFALLLLFTAFKRAGREGRPRGDSGGDGGSAAGSERGWAAWEPAQSSHGPGELWDRVYRCDGRRKNIIIIILVIVIVIVIDNCITLILIPVIAPIILDSSHC